MKKLMMLAVVISASSLLAGCSTPAQMAQQRMNECESKGISKDTCYLVEQNRQQSYNEAAQNAAWANARETAAGTGIWAKKDVKQHAQMTHKHRKELAHSGCTQVEEANGECTANSDKSQSRDLKQLSREAEAVMNGTIDDGAAFLLGQGWKPNNGKWHKQGYILTLVVEKGIVVNSQLSK
ncbi:YgdI/YgdR family lipoprotein [Enterobacter cloacae subsp. cloacae]|uniref:YgdI/YgdR family lipoprotein n=1 Tax=Enterobacter cloacae TaxID=550 RepID=UPI0020238303|nr:YgdI/YgdR family lipoprotein [Enterobacter cloacae]MCL8313319.1 YgdI/YgdR family lipoprotein [Enterobacter cloacae subsp. cloacae]